MKRKLLKKISIILCMILLVSTTHYVFAEEDDTEQNPVVNPENPQDPETPETPETPDVPETPEEPTIIPGDTPGGDDPVVTEKPDPTAVPTKKLTPKPTKKPEVSPTNKPEGEPTEIPTPSITAVPTTTPYATVIPPEKDQKKPGPAKVSDKKIEVKSPKVIKIDGIYENVWDNIETTKIENVSWGTSGASGGFKTYWDKEKLYILVDVDDKTPDTASEMFTRQDCVEIFVNESGKKPEAYDKGDLHFKVNRDGVVEYGHNASEDIVQYGVIKKDGGYMVEASIVFTSIKPSYGAKIGFDVRINDSQGKQDRDYMIQWSDTSMETFNNLTKIGTIKLK